MERISQVKHYFRRLIYLVVLFITCSAVAGSYEDFFQAIRRDDASTIQALVQRGMDPNTPNETGITAIHYAIQLESFRAANALAAAPGLALDKSNEHGETPLMMAALKGQLGLVRQLLDRGAGVNKTGWTALHYAAAGPDPALVKLLLDKGAASGALSPNGTTPLMMAAGYGAEGSVDVLLGVQADPRIKNLLGLTAADFARKAGRDFLAKRLDVGSQ